MDSAINQLALETGQQDGNVIDTVAAQSYLKTTWNPNDLLGNAYALTVVGGTQISVNASTKTSLNGVGIDWGAY
jgi:hypothetical protein